MTQKTVSVDNAAEAFLAVLADRGVRFLFGNAGTDFPPIIEALSKAALGQASAPTPVTVPHENLGISMAHGCFLATGQPQALMLHVNVGTANAICGLLNATRENIPILLMAGRTPISEEDIPGSRSVYIHWGQEMFDQAGMVREAVKWDYELRTPAQVEAVVDRALSIAQSSPAGPVYLTLPREVIAAGAGDVRYTSPARRHAVAAAAPDGAALAEAAGWLAQARRPLIVTASFGRNPAAVPALAEFAERFAIPVVGYRPRYVFLPTDHPMHLGTEPAALLAEADAVLVLECDVPWVPKLHKVSPSAKVIHLGEDPLFSRYPMRSFPSDLAIAAEPGQALRALAGAMAQAGLDAAVVDERRAALAKRRAEMGEAKARGRTAAPEGPITVPWVAACLNAAKRPDDVMFFETAFPIGLIEFTQPGTYFGSSPAGGLGWGLGAALGYKLGAPQRRVIAVIGDGSYMFGNPTPAHFVSAAHGLPTLTVIVNNRMWAAVRRATLAMYPEGAATRVNQAPLTWLEPSPDYERIVEASGGYGERVEDPAELPQALARALKIVEDGRQAVLNVITAYSDAEAKQDARR